MCVCMCVYVCVDVTAIKYETNQETVKQIHGRLVGYVNRADQLQKALDEGYDNTAGGGGGGGGGGASAMKKKVCVCVYVSAWH